MLGLSFWWCGLDWIAVFHVTLSNKWCLLHWQYSSLLATHLQSNQLPLALIGGSSNLMGTDFSQMECFEMKRIKGHCCFAGNRTESPPLIMWRSLWLSKNQTRLHFQLWNLGNLRLLESPISFRFWHLLLFARIIKTFLFWSSRDVYHSAHVVCVAHTKIFWGLGNAFQFSDQCWLRNNGKSPWKSVAQNVLPLFWLTTNLSWGRDCWLGFFFFSSAGANLESLCWTESRCISVKPEDNFVSCVDVCTQGEDPSFAFCPYLQLSASVHCWHFSLVSSMGSCALKTHKAGTKASILQDPAWTYSALSLTGIFCAWQPKFGTCNSFFSELSVLRVSRIKTWLSPSVHSWVEGC